MHCTGQIICGHKKDYKFVAESLFDPMNDLNTEKEIVDLYIFDGSSVCRKAKKLKVCLSYAVIYYCSRAYLS